MNEAHVDATPKHLWIVGGLALLWSAMGAYDYLMTQTANAAYMAKFTPEQLEFFYGFPKWVVSAWAIGVWGGVFGSLFLLLRQGAAVYFYGASVLGVLTATVRNYVFADGMAVSGGTGEIAFTVVIFVVAAMLLLYSCRMKTRGVLN